MLPSSANLFHSLGKFDNLRVHNHKAECARRHHVGLWTARRAGCLNQHFRGKGRRPVSRQPGFAERVHVSSAHASMHTIPREKEGREKEK